MTYGLGVLETALKYAMAKRDMGYSKIFNPEGKRIVT